MDESPKYTIQSTSQISSMVRDVVLSETPKGLARKVLRAEIVANLKNPENSVKACIVHQRRKTTAKRWEDLPGSTLAQSKPLEPSKFPLDSKETHALFDHLWNLYDVGDKGIGHGRVVVRMADEDKIIETDASRARIIRKLLESNHGEEVWHLIHELEPDLARKLSAALQHDRRSKVVDEFERSIGKMNPEEYWRQLFRANLWMLGGSNVKVLGEARVDISNTLDIPVEVDGGFMDIVELKRPDFPFWMQTKGDAGRFLYRKKHPVPYYELSGAMAQTSAYILQAEKKVTDTDFKKSHGVVPLKPRGLVVHGRSNEWTETEWEAFRLLNDQMHGVQVATFDHVLAQAKRILAIESEQT